MTISDDFKETCESGNSYVECIPWYIITIWNLLLGCLPIIFITADILRSFKKRKHWIPPVSFVLSSLTLQLLMVLNNSVGFSQVANDESGSWVGILAGRVSVCLFIACLLPAVASPLSPTMWTDMASLLVSTSMSVFRIALDIYALVKGKENYDDMIDYGYNGSQHVTCASCGLRVCWNVAIVVSIILLVVLLICAAVASIGIYQFVCLKIPIILSPQKFNHQFSWEKVEEHIIKSVLVVHSSNPQYIVARSILTSPIALIAAICNGILIHASFLGIPQTRLVNNIQICLLYPFIMLASGVIFWRCITATIYYPRKVSWKWSSIKMYFRMENFWLCYLEDLEDRYLRAEVMGGNRFKKLMNRWRGMVLHRSLRMLIKMQKFLVVFSKTCWLVLQFFLSNKYMERVFMRSGFQEVFYLNREKHHGTGLSGKATSEFDKYCEALLMFPGECPDGIWIASRKSIEYIKKQIRKGKEEGMKCHELIWLLKYKSSPDFCGEKHVNPNKNYLPIRLEVEEDLDVCKPSFKMAVVSLVTIMSELASFIPSTGHNNLINKAIEACYQAWNIMDIVENFDTEAAMLIKSADKLFQDLQTSRKWLGHHLPLRKGVGNPVVAAKIGIQNLVEKAKQMAVDYKSREWEEVAAGYRLYWLSLNINYQQMTSVEEIVDKMCSDLADVVAACTVKAVGVGVNDCKKWAANFEETNILKAAHVVGKVRNLMENVGWELNWSFSLEAQSVETWVVRASNVEPLRKHATFQTRPMIRRVIQS